jgi:hypothetical protein
MKTFVGIRLKAIPTYAALAGRPSAVETPPDADAVTASAPTTTEQTKKKQGKKSLPAVAVLPKSRPADPPARPATDPQPTEQAQAEPLPPGGRGEPGRSAPVDTDTKPKPGELVIDEQAAERALERTLVQAGALLLPFGRIEVEPSFTYTRRDEQSAIFAALASGEFAARADQRVKRNELEGAVDLRIGLPFDSQFEVGLPYNIVEQQIAVTAAERDEIDGWGHGLGDLRIGAAKTLLRENGWVPDLIGRVTWDSRTGERTDDEIALGNGFDQLRGGFTAVKRQDPLAFVGGVYYQRAFEDDNIKPGDEIGMSLAAVLAASPETSLSLSFDQAFINDFERNNRVINGTDQVQATLSAGIATILGRDTLLTITAGAGLTDDSPDYFVGISLPIRFELPVPY